MFLAVNIDDLNWYWSKLAMLLWINYCNVATHWWERQGSTADCWRWKLNRNAFDFLKTKCVISGGLPPRPGIFQQLYEKNFFAINTEPQWGECFCLLFIKWSSLEWKTKSFHLGKPLTFYWNISKCFGVFDILKSNDKSMAPFFICFLCVEF